MEINGPPKFNNFNNIDSELLDTGTAKEGKRADLSATSHGMEAKDFASLQVAKSKSEGHFSSDGDFDKPSVLTNSSGQSFSKPLEELFDASKLKIAPGLEKKLSGDFPRGDSPRPSNNQSPSSFPNQSPNPSSPAQSSNPSLPNQSPNPSFPGQGPTQSRPNQDPSPSFPGQSPNPSFPNQSPTQSRPNQSPTSSFPNQSPTQSSPSSTRPTSESPSSSPIFSAPVSRPNASDLPQVPIVKDRNDSVNLPKENDSSTFSSNQIRENLQKSFSLEPQKVEKQVEKQHPENRANFNQDRKQLDNKPNNNQGRGPDKTSTQIPTSTAPVEEVEKTLEIEITQSIEVKDTNLETSNEHSVENENAELELPSQERFVPPGLAKGRNNNETVALLNNSEFPVEPAISDLVDNALASVVGKIINNPESTGINTDSENIQETSTNTELNDPTSLNNQNKLTSTITESPENLSISQFDEPELVNSASDLNNATRTASSLLGKSIGQSRTNDISNLIATTNSKVFSIPVGQSLEHVASELGIDVFDLLKANPQLLKDPLLFAGQKLKMPNPQDANTLVSDRLTNTQSSINPNETLGQTLGKLQDPTKLPLDPTKTNLASISTQAELGKAHSLNSNSNLLNTRLTESERSNERAVEKTAATTVKQNLQNVTPGFGVYDNREIEIEVEEKEQQSNRKFNLPEPFDEWADHIYFAADKYNLEASLIAAVIWCESAGKNIVGKNGHGFGLMQIDDRHHKNWLKANDNGLNPATNIDFGVSILRKNIDYFRGKMAAGIAAYDCGIDLVEEAIILGKVVDYFTRDKDYSLRVLNQQNYLRRFFD